MVHIDESELCQMLVASIASAQEQDGLLVRAVHLMGLRVTQASPGIAAQLLDYSAVPASS